MSSQRNVPSAAQDEPDVEDMIDSSICAEFYRKLEDCLADNDRKWSACQEQVKALKDCYQRATSTAFPKSTEK
jgi:cytochrome c oxidase assembly factor 4